MPFPLKINLGELTQGTQNFTDFYGLNTINADQLPNFLILGKLDKSSFSRSDSSSFFERLLNKTKIEWSARWQGDTPDSYLDVGWNNKSGWTVNGYWYGKYILGAGGHADLPFSRLFQTPPYENCLDSDPANTKLHHISHIRRVPHFFSLPSGWMRSIVFPISVNNISHVIKTFNEIDKRKLYSPVTGNILFANSTFLMNDLHESLALEESQRESKMTGIFCQDLPQPKNDNVLIHRIHYNLVLTCGFSDVPYLNKLFKRFTLNNSFFPPFVLSALAPSLCPNVYLNVPLGTITLYFDAHWNMDEFNEFPDTKEEINLKITTILKTCQNQQKDMTLMNRMLFKNNDEAF